MTAHEPLQPSQAMGEGSGVNAASPWRKVDDRGPSGGLPRILMLTRQAGRAPTQEQLEAVGLESAESHMAFHEMAEDSPLFAEADALVIEIAPRNQADFEAFDRIVHLAAGQLPVIAAVDGLTVADTRTLLRAGALDVLPLPFTAEELRQAVEPARRPARPAAPRAQSQPPRRQGKVISFLGTTGGAGVTSIATQLGILWSQNARVCYIDFDVQFGNAALLLDLRPSLHLGHLIEDAERLDPDLLQSVAMNHASGMALIASPAEMMPLDVVTNEFVDRLLRLATQTYDVVLVDLPTAWTEWTVRALQRSDAICLLTALNVPGLHQARRQLEVIEANGLMPKLKITANRVQKSLFGKVDLKETEAVLGRKVDFTIANDYPTVSSANDEGRALKDVKPSSRVVKDLKAVAEALQGAFATEGDGQ